MRILIVEDESSVRGFLCRALAHFFPGAEIVVATDGQQGLDLFLAGPASLVISDNRMPKMSGIELLQQLRARSAVPFVMISADASLERRAALAGASAFLNKPVSLGELRAAIRGALAGTIGYTEPCAQ